MRPLDDLRTYCSHAFLEPMATTPNIPSTPSSSFSEHLNVPASKPRPLIFVDRLTDNFFDENLQHYPFTVPLRPAPSDVPHFEINLTLNVTLPGEPSLGSGDLVAPAEDLTGVTDWIIHYPLSTARALLNLVDYGTTYRWNFHREPSDASLFSTITLYRTEGGLWTPNVAIFVVPPWVMTLEDFRSFVDVDVVRDLRSASALKSALGNHKGCELSPSELLWCEILDRCAAKSVARFALTSYDHWVYGNFQFELGTCYATITPIKHAHSRTPSVLQGLLFLARPVEYRDVGLSSQVSSTASWETSGTARPLKRKAPSSEAGSRVTASKSSRTSTGSGSHRRPRKSSSQSSTSSRSHSRSRTSRQKVSREDAPRSVTLFEPQAPRLELIHEELNSFSEGVFSEVASLLSNSDAFESREMDERPDSGSPTFVEDLSVHSGMTPLSFDHTDARPFGGSNPPSESSGPSRPRSPSVEIVEVDNGMGSDSQVQAYLVDGPAYSTSSGSSPLPSIFGSEDDQNENNDEANVQDQDQDGEWEFEHYEGPGTPGTEYTLPSVSEALSFRSEFSTESARVRAQKHYMERSEVLNELLPVQEAADPMREMVERSPSPPPSPSSPPPAPLLQPQSLPRVFRSHPDAIELTPDMLLQPQRPVRVDQNGVPLQRGPLVELALEGGSDGDASSSCSSAQSMTEEMKSEIRHIVRTAMGYESPVEEEEEEL